MSILLNRVKDRCNTKMRNNKVSSKQQHYDGLKNEGHHLFCVLRSIK
uniref:Uncharacterized protein n=1 Tax=Rhizophora mucronata TaxID=61149 RepID=A0A2P2P6S7_RHIMU